MSVHESATDVTKTGVKLPDMTDGVEKLFGFIGVMGV